LNDNDAAGGETDMNINAVASTKAVSASAVAAQTFKKYCCYYIGRKPSLAEIQYDCMQQSWWLAYHGEYIHSY